MPYMGSSHLWRLTEKDGVAALQYDLNTLQSAPRMLDEPDGIGSQPNSIL
jgi:hypothetical protein